jgi:hypothetical protein
MPPDLMAPIVVDRVDVLTRLELAPTTDGEWVLTEPLRAAVHFKGGAWVILTVPEGFPTDLASVPRLPVLFLLFGGKARVPAVLHDYLYEQGADREYADAVFLAAMKDEPGWRRFLMWAGVRLGGWAYYLNGKATAPEGPRGDL